MTEHTPGPWTQPETKRTHNRWFVEGGGRLVAAASGPQFAIPADEADANARLIAAAPDLLWFTQQLFNAVDTGMLTLDSPADETLATVLRKGREARAKAEKEIQ
jgi:hypothetical protein